MADAGFHQIDTRDQREPYAKDKDVVACGHCKLSLVGWKEGDDPFKIHAERSPKCFFVRTSSSGSMREERGVLGEPVTGDDWTPTEAGVEMLSSSTVVQPPSSPSWVKAKKIVELAKWSRKERKRHMASVRGDYPPSSPESATATATATGTGTTSATATATATAVLNKPEAPVRPPGSCTLQNSYSSEYLAQDMFSSPPKLLSSSPGFHSSGSVPELGFPSSAFAEYTAKFGESKPKLRKANRKDKSKKEDDPLDVEDWVDLGSEVEEKDDWVKV